VDVRPISWNGAPARLVTLRDAAFSEQLKRLQTEIAEGLRVVSVKTRFMNHVSHELRNTLSMLTTAAFCLKDGLAGPLTPRQMRLVDVISRNVERQTRMIENVLDLARFQSGKLQIRPRPVDVNAVIAALVEEYGLTGAAAKLQVNIDGGLSPVLGDPDLIAQVLRNLVENALRFARQKVVVSASRAGAQAVSVSVSDDGAGIPPERLGELFTDFVQLARPASGGGANAPGYKGTGLGLAICKEIVEGHRGSIWAENLPGHGARFSFILPARAEAAVDPQPEERVPASTARERPARALDGAVPSYSSDK
jgi:signal transduction histidine kinase